MTARRWALTFLLVGVISHLVACGSGGSGSSSNTQPSVSIALNPAPSSTAVSVGNTTGIQFTPVVSNDPGNYGVDWAVTCSLSSTAGACGTLSIPTYHSASGSAVSYIPPTTLPAGSLNVNVTVFATADHTKNVTTPVTVTSYVDVLNGTYILQVMGSDGTHPYQSTGAFVFDGNGNITSGQQTLNTLSGFSALYSLQGSSGSPSTYFIGRDGRGTITLNLQSGVIGISETFSLVVLSSSKALIAELDTSSGSGTLELQDSAAAATMPTGAYSFVTSGTDSGVFFNPSGSNVLPTAIGGVLNIDNNPSPGSISGNGSLADQDYYTTDGTAAALQSCLPPTVTGSVSQPGTLGVVTIALKGLTCFGIQQPGSIQFTGYIVDATHIRLIESDDINGSGGFLTAGIAVSQGTAVGTFTNASLSGAYVLGVLGYDLFDYSFFGVPGFSFTSAAVVSADGNGNLTGGITDTFYPGALSLIGLGAYTAAPLTGTYQVDTNFIGRAQLQLNFNSCPTPQPYVLFYLTGNGTPPLVLWSEGEDVNFPAIGTGIAYPQVTNASAVSFGNPETYGIGFTQNAGSGEADGSGDMTSTISGVTGTLTGTLDDPINNGIFGSGSGPFPLLDTFALPADSFGRIAGTFMNIPGSGTAGPYVEYYLVNGNQGFLVETDLLITSTVTLGYFTQSCDVTNMMDCQAAAKQVSAKPASRRSSSRSLRK